MSVRVLLCALAALCLLAFVLPTADANMASNMNSASTSSAAASVAAVPTDDNSEIDDSNDPDFRGKQSYNTRTRVQSEWLVDEDDVNSFSRIARSIVPVDEPLPKAAVQVQMKFEHHRHDWDPIGRSRFYQEDKPVWLDLVEQTKQMENRRPRVDTESKERDEFSQPQPTDGCQTVEVGKKNSAAVCEDKDKSIVFHSTGLKKMTGVFSQAQNQNSKFNAPSREWDDELFMVYKVNEIDLAYPGPEYMTRDREVIFGARIPVTATVFDTKPNPEAQPNNPSCANKDLRLRIPFDNNNNKGVKIGFFPNHYPAEQQQYLAPVDDAVDATAAVDAYDRNSERPLRGCESLSIVDSQSTCMMKVDKLGAVRIHARITRQPRQQSFKRYYPFPSAYKYGQWVPKGSEQCEGNDVAPVAEVDPEDKADTEVDPDDVENSAVAGDAAADEVDQAEAAAYNRNDNRCNRNGFTVISKWYTRMSRLHLHAGRQPRVADASDRVFSESDSIRAHVHVDKVYGGAEGRVSRRKINCGNGRVTFRLRNKDLKDEQGNFIEYSLPRDCRKVKVRRGKAECQFELSKLKPRRRFNNIAIEEDEDDEEDDAVANVAGVNDVANCAFSKQPVRGQLELVAYYRARGDPQYFSAASPIATQFKVMAAITTKAESNPIEGTSYLYTN